MKNILFKLNFNYQQKLTLYKQLFNLQQHAWKRPKPNKRYLVQKLLKRVAQLPKRYQSQMVQSYQDHPFQILNYFTQKYQKFWQFIFALITIASGVLFHKIYEYQTNPHFDKYRRGQVANLAIYGLPFAAIFTIFDMLVHYLFDQLCEKHYITLQNYTDPQAKKKRSYTLVKWGYSLIYYSLSSIAGFLVLKNTIYFPKWLGGNGDPMFLFNNYPDLSQASTLMEVFYILQFGKHFSRAFTHIFIRAQGNFYQYALHHGLSVFLIFYSYCMDFWLVGTFVLIIHDFTDFTLILGRAYKDFRYKNDYLLAIFSGIAFISWVVCRIFIFTYCCIYSLFWSIFNVFVPKADEIYYETVLYAVCFMGVMLSALQVMHLFWTYYIIQSVVSVNVSKKLAKHTYD